MEPGIGFMLLMITLALLPILLLIGLIMLLDMNPFPFRRRGRRLMESLQMLYFRATYKWVKPGITTIGTILLSQSNRTCCGELAHELDEIVRTSSGIHYSSVADICPECGTVLHRTRSWAQVDSFGGHLREGMNFFEFMASIAEERAEKLFGRIDDHKPVEDDDPSNNNIIKIHDRIKKT